MNVFSRLFKVIPHPNDTRMPLTAHLEELRRRLIFALLGITVATTLCLFKTQELIGFIIRPAYIVLQKYHQIPSLQSLSPPDTFMIYMKISLLGGLILSAPWVIYQIWLFVAAGLYPRERRAVERFIVPSMALFVVGVSFMFYVVLPIALNFFASFNQNFLVPDWSPNLLERQLLGTSKPAPSVDEISPLNIPVLSGDPAHPKSGDVWFNRERRQLKLVDDNQTYQIQLQPTTQQSIISYQYSIDFYISFVLEMALAFGVAFQMPLVVVFLTWAGIVTVTQMSGVRKYVILVIFIVAAVITPPDVLSQLALAFPMLLLFEGGMLVSRFIQKTNAT